MSTRTDIHRPSAPEFDPETYDLLAVLDLAKPHTATVRAALDRGYSFAGHQKIQQCGHCGARIRYAALLLHRPTDTLIYVGETCLDSRFSGTRADFLALRNSAKADRERAHRDEIFAANLTDAVRRDWTLEVLGHHDAVLALDEGVREFALDIRRALYRRTLSDRQVSALAAAIDRARVRAEERAARDAESVPAPEGPQAVSGVVVSVKYRENPYDGRLEPKMVVRDDRGFAVWSAVPAALRRLVDSDEAALVGKRVEFDATLTRSDAQESFAFAKRPTRAALVSVF